MRKNKNEIHEKLNDALQESGYKDINIVYNADTKLNEVSFIGHDEIRLYCVIKNVVKSGWADKPLIKRVQLPKYEGRLLPVSTFKETAIIVGYIHILDKDMFAFWSFYRNISHNTNRSCYVGVNSLFRGYLDGYYRSFESDQNVWIADSKNLKKVLYDYMKKHNTTMEKINEHLE